MQLHFGIDERSTEEGTSFKEIARIIGLNELSTFQFFEEAMVRLKYLVTKDQIPLPYHRWLYEKAVLKKIWDQLNLVQMEMFGLFFVNPVYDRQVAIRFGITLNMARGIHRLFEVIGRKELAAIKDPKNNEHAILAAKAMASLQNAFKNIKTG